MFSSGTTLLILGNGFDKHAKLKSSFVDFFSSMIPDNLFYTLEYYFIHDYPRSMLNNNIYHANLVLQEFTIWHYYLLMFYLDQSVENWKDIEGLIHNSLEINKDIKDVNFGTCYWTRVQHIYNTLLSLLDKGDRFDKVIIDHPKNEAILAFVLLYNPQKFDKKLIQNSISKLLFDQMLLFEMSFNNYLLDNIDEEKYQQNVSQISNNIFKNLKYGSNDISVLNFNYTSPKILKEQKSLLRCMESVHGKLSHKKILNIGESNIIIGIDSSEINTNEIGFVFTKTSRKISMFFKDTTNIENTLNTTINQIVFYGHSLGKQDYAYFQSIFDYLDIYNKNVELLFLYSIYNTDLTEKIKADQLASVTKLLEAYGKSKNNAQGKNLMHKILLESRLKIKEIPY